MAHRYMILLDVEEGYGTGQNNCIRFANTADQIEGAVREVAQHNCTGTISVYELAQLRKLKQKPVYQKYSVKGGEIVPE